MAKYAKASAGAAAPAAAFSTGVGDRTASVRVPQLVVAKGLGYLEDRRLGAVADPYEAARVLLEAAGMAAGSSN